MSIKKLFFLSYSSIIIGVIVLGVLSMLMSRNEKVLNEKHEQRYHSYLLADQLRQSSDDLTRMARTYVISGDPKYEKMYWDILAIRNGEKPRPEHYDRIYWDLVLNSGDKPRSDGEAIPLQQLMKEAGFTEEEFARLQESQNNSDGLVTTETIAMNAVKGLYDDGTGNYVKRGEPDWEMARRIMHDERYHQDKASIMKPIDEFFILLEERTKANVDHYVQSGERLLLIIQMMVVGLAILSGGIGVVVTRRILRQVGGEPSVIMNTAQRIAGGDLTVDFATDKKELVGIAAAMQEMTGKIRDVLIETEALTQAVQEGKLDVRGNTEDFSGGWRDLVTGVNNTINAFMTPFNVTAEYLDRIAKGDIPEKIREEYKGDFVEVINNLNQCIDAISGLVDETGKLTEAAVEGRLHTRGDASQFSGEYAAIVEGINNTIATLVGHIDQLPIPIEIMNTEFALQYINKTGAEMLDASAESLIGQHCYDLLQTSDCQTGNCVCARAMSSGDLETGEIEAHPGGKDLQVSYAGMPIKDRDGMIIGALEFLQDQTEVKQAMTAVEQQSWMRTGQAELSNLMRGELDARTLAKNVITYITKYLGVSVGALYLANGQNGDTVLELTGSYAYLRRKGSRNVFKLGESLVGQAALEKEYIHYSKIPVDYLAVGSGLGETTPRHIFVAPFVYEGDLKGVIELGSVQEFSDAQLEFVKQAVENVGIAFQSVQNRFKMQNLLHATQQQAEELQQQQEELRQTNEELEEQTKALQASEQRLQQQQEELRQTNEELEAQTKELAQQRKEVEEKNRSLQQAGQLLEEKAKDLEIASKYKSEFLANMSHELRTPLNSMLILSNLLADNKEGNLSDKQIEFARTVHTSGQELLTLINEVLDLSKVEAGKMELNLADMGLQGLANYIEQNFAHVAQEKDLYLKVEMADDLPASIYTDRQRIEQVLKNFLSNAFKFTEKGGITLQINRPGAKVQLRHSALDPRNTIAIAIADTGIGIPKEKQRLIFEAFQQADGSTSRKYGGTGLGLSISRELAKMLGGEIQLQSEEGKGSTFTLYLPESLQQEVQEGEPEVKTGQAEAEEQQQTSETEEQPQPAEPAVPSGLPQSVERIRDDRRTLKPGEKSLLIIEDDPKFAAILFDLARERGFKALIAGDGSAGLQLAYQYLPSAIILDIGLPGTDGWAVMEKLQVNPDTEPIPVYMISAQDAPGKADKLGIIGYLTKPVNTETLNDAFLTIEEHLTEGGKHALIVEDDEIMRTSLTELIAGHLPEVTAAATGKEALKLLQTGEFTCLVLDLGLPDMSGFDFLDHITKDEAIPPLHIIVYTGRELSKEEDRRLQQYTDSVIIKGAKSAERLLDEMTLLLHRVETSLPKAQQRQPKVLHDRDAVLHGKTVLLVDDDIRNVYALANVLDDKGLNILTAENGRHALEELDAHADEIHLVLMDIMMPEMDDYEAMREIRKQSRFRKLPIISLTAKAMKGDRQKCLEAGANDYLSKPIDTDKLFSLLRVWLY